MNAHFRLIGKIKKAKFKLICLFIYIFAIKYVLLSSFPLYLKIQFYFIKDQLEIYSYIPIIFQCTIENIIISSKSIELNTKLFINQTKDKKLLNQIIPKEQHRIANKCQYIILREVFISKDCVFGDSHIFVDLRKSNQKSKLISSISKDFEVINSSINNAIALSHKEKMSYSDIFLNFMFPLMNIPQKLWNSSTLIIPFSTNPYFHQIAQLIHPNISIIKLKKNQFVHAHELLTVISPISSSQHFVKCGLKYSEFIRKKLNLTKIKPTEYSLCNRNTKYNRSIYNFNEIFNEVNQTFPEIKWTIISDVYNSIQQTAHVWASLKLVFTISGNHLVKMVLMNKRTVVCVASSNTFNFEMSGLSQTLNIFYYCFFIDDFKENQKFVEIDKHLVINALKTTIYVSKYQKWPKYTHINKVAFSF